MSPVTPFPEKRIGHGKPGPGRPKGSKGRKAKKAVEVAQKAAAVGMTPLEYMLAVLRAPIPPELAHIEVLDAQVVASLMAWHNTRMDAAKAAAPYVHPRLTSMEVSGKDGAPIVPPLIQFVRETPAD